ncbi:MAG TPA: MFS transporter [Clostridiales bacterium]|nr:MFS transporter [Clostridiales bacterium]
MDRLRDLRAELLMVFGVTLFGVMGVSSIAPALPKVVEAFGFEEAEVGLLITAFTLPGVLLTPFAGVVADRLGRKRVLVPSLFLFGLAGGLCAFTRRLDVLLALRVVQGTGAAALGSLSTTLIGDLWEGPARARAMGLNASVLSLGTAVYPLVGGGLAVVGWNWPFLLPWLALPFGVVVARRLESPQPDGQGDLRDYLKGAWKGLRDARVLGVFASGTLIFVILYGSYLTYFTLLLGRVFEAPPHVIGAMMFIMSITTAAASSQLGTLARRFAKPTLVKAGFLAYTVSLAVVPLVREMWLLVVPVLIFGTGHGVIVPSLQTILAELAPLEHRAIFMSLNGTMLRVGQTLGPVVMGLVFASAGYRGVFWAGSLAGVTGLVIAAATLGAGPRACRTV